MLRLPCASIVAISLLIAACAAPESDGVAAGAEDELTLGAARTDATVTRLPNGTWLVVGGTASDSGVVARSEIVDAAADSATPGPLLASGRTGHSATLLADGRVVVVGGVAKTGRAVASVEIVDPAGGTVIAGAPLPASRTGHSATRLPDGRVFVAGGVNEYGGAQRSTFLYDVASNSWAPGPDLMVARAEHTATALPDGTVVLAGGRGLSGGGKQAGSPLASVERFDPASGALASAGSLVVRRAAHAATLLADGSILVVGGDAPDGVTDTAERLLPAASRSERIAPMGVARAAHRMVVVGGRAVAIGGRSDAPDAEGTYQIFDIPSGIWSMPVSLGKARSGAIVEAAGAAVFACGGTRRSGPSTSVTATCEKIDPAAAIAPVPALPRKTKLRLEARETDGAAVRAIMGGKSEPFVFDDARGKTITLSPMKNDGDPQTTYAWDGSALVALAPAAASPAPSRRAFGLASDRARGRVVLFGGERRTNFNLAETWEWDGATWSNVTPSGVSPAPRVNPQLTFDTARGKVLLFGGRNNAGALNDLWSWDGATWTELTPGQAPRPPVAYTAGNVFAFDEARGVAVLHASRAGTWEWNGVGWREARRAATGEPETMSLVYDAGRGAVVAHATTNACSTPTPNAAPSGSTLLGWNGAGYATLDAAFKAAPAGCTGTPFASFDRTRGRMILGGMWQVNTTWPIAELSTEEVPNRAPRVADVRIEPAGPVYAGAPLTITVRGEDPDGHVVRVLAGALPQGAVLDQATGVVRWTPRADQVGAAKVVVGVTDGIRTAMREVPLDVQRFDSTLFPQGRIALRADVTWKGSTQDCGGTRGCVSSVGNTGHAACAVEGDNPGRVTVRCDGQTSYSWQYDRFRGTWASSYESVSSKGEVGSTGRWSTVGGTQVGSFAMSGAVRKDALGDLELCIGEIKFEPNATLRARYAGESCAPLYPVP